MHTLHSILFIVVCAAIADADGPAGMEEFAVQKRNWLERFVDIEDEIPSHDTIGSLSPDPTIRLLTRLLWIRFLRR
ncbi:hypothetical protein CA13_66470 [Planctomycetes bacterium CA13]|uniref:H repeat-associated protein N-terminal domain-containing protein n=2 Tax=Novipirellula herctigrandis TaxID=2527986 RepID=A0A5C5ZDC0_9BACT|nr:hypothetical protein CA13_66470 [Planctomycetes bacterium CA13]